MPSALIVSGGVLVLFAAVVLVFMRGRRPDPDLDQE